MKTILLLTTLFLCSCTTTEEGKGGYLVPDFCEGTTNYDCLFGEEGDE